MNMQKILKLLVLVFFIFGGLFYAGMRSENHVLAGQAEIDSKKLYLQNCARCHGADGKSLTELGKKLDSPDLTSKKIKKLSMKKVLRVISKGDGPMPAFAKKLSKEEIDSLAQYIKTL